MSEAEPSKSPVAEGTPGPTAPAGGAQSPKPPTTLMAELKAFSRTVEWRPVLGIAMLASIAIIANNWLNQRIERRLDPPRAKPPVQWAIGQEADVEITLITDDLRKLGCASATLVEGAHCAFDGEKRRWPRAPDAPVDDNNVDIIQPYRTADTNQLLFVHSLWAQPEVAMRVHLEPPDSVASDKLLRFVAYCRVRFVGELTNAWVRWDQGAAWQGDNTALVAKPLSCTLTSPGKG
jgi:hypothetical protein